MPIAVVDDFDAEARAVLETRGTRDDRVARLTADELRERGGELARDAAPAASATTPHHHREERQP